LLVENRAHTTMAGLIVVAAEPELQHARLVERDRMSADDAQARIAAQAALADKRAAATWVIENAGDLAALEREVERVVADIQARFGAIRLPKPPRAATSPGARAARLATPAALITGFPAFTARRMIQQILAAEPETRLYVLAREPFAADADGFL